MKGKIKSRIVIFIVLLAVCMTVVPVRTATASEDYRGWSQGDSRWGALRLGRSSYTVRRSGCLVTSITKLMIQSGVKDVDEFNVGTMTKWMNKNGGFVGAGLLSWDKAGKYNSKFKYCGNLMSYSSYNAKAYNAKLLKYIKQGYHLVINVKYGGHWVAVDEAKSLASGKIYIMDSASLQEKNNKNLTLIKKYRVFNRVVGFKGGKTATMNDLNALLNKGEPEDDSYTQKVKREGVELAEVCSLLSEPVKGQVYVIDNMKYEVTDDSVDGNGTVKLAGSTISKKVLASLVVEDTVNIGGITMKITEIGTKSFYNYTALKSVTIGKNIKVLGKSCFYKCTKLKNIAVRSKNLTAVGKNAIKKINSKVKISVPSNKKTKYLKLFEAGK